MRLSIGSDRLIDNDSMYIPYSLLGDKAVHLFIASSMWDTLVVEIDEKIPEGVLKYMILKCNDKKAILPDRKLTQKELALVCEMYPEKAGSVRRAYMLERPIAELLV